MLEALRHDLQAEVEEVPEHLLQIEALGPADFGVLGRHEARQVDGEVGLQRRVLEEVRHHLLLVGVLLQLAARCGRRRCETSFTSRSSGILRATTTSAMRSTSSALFTAYGMLVM